MKALFKYFLAKRGGMPAYPSVKIGDLTTWVVPNGFRLSRQKPFYNGDDIYLDLVMVVPYPHPKKSGFEKAPLVDIIFEYTWDFVNRSKDNKVIIAPTKDTYHLINQKGKNKANPNKGKVLYETGNPDLVRFTISKAIHIGYQWDFDRYDLRLIKENGEKEILFEFTLRDIDEHGENYHMLLLNLLFGAGVSFIVALLTVMIFGKYL